MPENVGQTGEFAVSQFVRSRFSVTGALPNETLLWNSPPEKGGEYPLRALVEQSGDTLYCATNESSLLRHFFERDLGRVARCRSRMYSLCKVALERRGFAR